MRIGQVFRLQNQINVSEIPCIIISKGIQTLIVALIFTRNSTIIALCHINLSMLIYTKCLIFFATGRDKTNKKYKRKKKHEIKSKEKKNKIERKMKKKKKRNGKVNIYVL